METTEKTTKESTESSVKIPENKGNLQVHKDLKTFLLSKKLWMSIFGLSVLWLAYWKQVNYLYSFSAYPQDMAAVLVPAYIGLTRDFMVAFTGVVMSFLGVEGFVSWRHGTESVISQASSFIQEKIKEDKTEKIDITENTTITYNNTKEDDYTLEEPLEKYEY